MTMNIVSVSGHECCAVDVRTFRTYGRCHVALKKHLDGIDLYSICCDLDSIFEDSEGLI